MAGKATNTFSSIEQKQLLYQGCWSMVACSTHSTYCSKEGGNGMKATVKTIAKNANGQEVQTTCDLFQKTAPTALPKLI